MDELGALERELAPLAFKIARIEPLRKAIREHFKDEPADKLFLATGEKFAVSVGARSRERVTNIPALIKAIGARAFNAIASVTVKKLEAEVPAAIVEDVSTFALTGFRPLKVFERGKLLG